MNEAKSIQLGQVGGGDGGGGVGDNVSGGSDQSRSRLRWWSRVE
jgi:hypothetical protein